ncbi:MAG: hypothetical protein KDA41_20945 [Planctomycetales bacterium]|nr:hypothetical protein [Planctomycetales bacterium]
MIGAITFKERGATPRGMAKRLNVHKRAAGQLMGNYFHRNLVDKRFTEPHAQEAGYTKRKGESIPRGDKRFRRSYTGRKLRKYGHTRPLEFSGETRQRIRAYANITATSTSRHTTVKVAYPGARRFNLRHPKSRINMALEFRRIVPSEFTPLARVYDADLEQRLRSDSEPAIQRLA